MHNPYGITRALCAGALAAYTTFAVAASPSPDEPSAALTLQQALDLALAHNPELATLSHEVLATEAGVQQSGVLPNPVLGVAAENFGNTRLRDEGDRSTRLELGQLIELGGKRAARVRLAEAGRELAEWDYRAKRSELVLQVSLAHVDVLAAQERLALARESLALAAQFLDGVARKVRAGKAAPVEETRARLTTSAGEIDLEQAQRELAAARHRLAALWGGEPQFASASGNLELTPPLPQLDRLQAQALLNPDVARWDSEVAHRDAGVRMERAKAVPDVTLTGSVARFSQFNDTAYTVGIAVPLPVFDRNRGGVLEAARRLDKSLDAKRAAQLRVSSDLAALYERLGAMNSEIRILRDSILPSAQSAYETIDKGYRLGKFGFLDVLDAERSWFQTRGQYLRALAEYQRAMKELERLAGTLDPSFAAPR